MPKLFSLSQSPFYVPETRIRYSLHSEIENAHCAWMHKEEASDNAHGASRQLMWLEHQKRECFPEGHTTSLHGCQKMQPLCIAHGHSRAEIRVKMIK